LYTSYAYFINCNNNSIPTFNIPTLDLHSGDYFNSVVAYLRGLLDKEGTLIDEAEREKCRKTFLHAVQLEEDFFNMAYT